ncbi:OLC1v1036299C1 [Oldenlandia corymbosa var. corymbosa]|uniref:OLC1v1036299C1 n=1 Tax=Oldenlandia corymbosa var. corymbosa TaxID=529605 RepID=A0AAV1CVI8_OLDCO|nr:OLC1v1036299C1 [Oldenlandia corymbosa var. corymbosa]
MDGMTSVVKQWSGTHKRRKVGLIGSAPYSVFTVPSISAKTEFLEGAHLESLDQHRERSFAETLHHQQTLVVCTAAKKRRISEPSQFSRRETYPFMCLLSTKPRKTPFQESALGKVSKKQRRETVLVAATLFDCRPHVTVCEATGGESSHPSQGQHVDVGDRLYRDRSSRKRTRTPTDIASSAGLNESVGHKRLRLDANFSRICIGSSDNSEDSVKNGPKRARSEEVLPELKGKYGRGADLLIDLLGKAMEERYRLTGNVLNVHPDPIHNMNSTQHNPEQGLAVVEPNQPPEHP